MNKLNMKVKSTLFHSLLAAAAMLLMAPGSAQAQSMTFTITNGTAQWLESADGTPYALAYKSTGTPKFSTDAVPSSGVTYDVNIGTHYIRLNTAGDGSITTTTVFDKYCIWHITDNPGYCYQEHEEGGTVYRYYLRGTTEGIAVWKVRKGQSLSTATMWHIAEAGGYVDQSNVRNGVKYIDYRWFAFNGTLATTSCAAEHRPEARRCLDVSCSHSSWYCPNGSGSGAACSAAVHLPVEIVDYAADIARPSGTNQGLQTISLSQSVIENGQSINASPVYTASALSGTATYQYTQPYRAVTRYTRLKGINFQGTGSEYVYNSRGIPTSTVHYFYSDDDYTTAHSTPPAAQNINMSSANIASYQWSIPSEATRYLSITGENTANPTINCFAIPAFNDFVTTLTLTITADNGVSESATVTLTVSADPHHIVKTESENSVFIGGDVFGGGRMADVHGATDVLVINCDTISRVYGGNDITGTVTGGSTVTIGNASSSDFIGINSVYGAGNGYYSYGGTSQAFTTCLTAINEGTEVRLWGDNSGDVIATAAVATNAPLIYKTRVFINSPWAIIDTVFGGARNADVLPLDPNITTYATVADTLASVTVNAGTIYAVFGGNNVGGCLNNIADTVNNLTRTAVNINMTNIQGITPAQAIAGTGTPSWSTDTAVVNSYYTNFGRDWGIRYVYGGGNKVTSALRTDVYVNGGMVDTVFAGGNQATVFRANAIVNCDGPNMIYRNGWTQDHDAAWAGSRPDTMASKWVGTRGSYNIRALFGGNNRAAMECVPDVLLQAGGIAAVYGGGNAGDMTNEVLNIGSGTHHYNARHVAAINAAKAEFNETKNKQVPPAAALGTFIHVAGTSTNVWIDYIYGGCRAANVTHATMVHLEGGNIGTVFGGCNISGNVGWAKPDLQAHIGARGRGGTYVALDDNITVYNNVYGGSNGYYHCVDNEQSAAAKYVDGVIFRDNQGTPFDPFNDHLGLTRPTHNYTHVAMNGGQVFGNVYGGGNHATVGFFNSTYGYPTPSGEQSAPATPKVGGVHISLVKGEIFGNAFGGSNMATVYGLAYFYIGDKPNDGGDGGRMVIHGDVYGGNDRLGDVGNNVNIPFVDASGNNLKASDNTELNEGGKAAYNTYIKVEGTPYIKRLFGGGNGAYNYNGEYPEYPEIEAYCSSSANHTTAPVLASAFVDVHTAKGARIDTLFGGGNAVDVQDRVMVLVNTQQHLYNEEALNDPDQTDITIGTIFGGNNVASMACVPSIEFKKGVVSTIFGGGNMGHMLGSSNTITDLCGNNVPSVSSFVHINSTEATVARTVFGGCNKADVHGMAYVLIEQTSDHGIDTVYGGNDVSGRITGDTRVDVYGGKVGTIYGGSNGFYDYEMLSPGDYRVREFAHSTNTGTILYENSIGSPYVDATNVNIFGGTIAHNIYGGGRMGDCRITNVNINDRTTDSASATGCSGATPSTILGFVFGGGEGDTARLDIAHRGNILEATNVNLYHATSVIAQAYGGGKGGDVLNANITSYNTWDHSFQKIFGGCWGADVSGTARLTIDANLAMLEESPTLYTAEKVYGGNDFSGNCYRSEVTINAGRFDTIYGAGCGNYPTSAYTNGTSLATQTRDLYVPNNEEVVVTINGTVNNDPYSTNVWVNGELYGGGQMGTAMRYKKNSEGRYLDALNNIITSAAQEKVADTNQTVATAYDDPQKYAYIILNIHGGEFSKDIFAGAQGQEGLGQLIYGLKILNMDAGTVEQSVYGGSQAVSDGYSRQECNTHPNHANNAADRPIVGTHTTLRPSSILNLVGGTVNNHVYGAGYKGFAHGSVYVNVGYDAVENSTVWRTAYGPTSNRVSSAYADFKPGATEGLSDALALGEDLVLAASVYAGANWGQNTGSYEFTGQGFFGGESRILIDGNGYADAPGDGIPMIDIVNSVLGAGTSVLGGDRLSRIDIRNFGVFDQCASTQDLMAIQRADALYLQNTGIIYYGITDASSALYSPNYAINKVDTVNAVGYNIIQIEAPKADISTLRFFEDVADQTCYDYITYPAAGSCLIPASLTDLNGGTQVCSVGDVEDTACAKIERIHPVNHKYTALLIDNGVTVDVQKESGEYGEMVGYAYLIAQDSTKPVVRARIKNNTTNPNDGGFCETCNADNSGADGSMNYQTFTSGGYRFWAPGRHRSTREVVLLAHSDPNALPEDKTIKVTNGSDGTAINHNYSLAHTQIVLPPSHAGYYYKLDAVSGVKVSEDNDVMYLTDIAWRPSSWSAPHNDDWATAETQGESASDWFQPSGREASFVPESYIAKNPNEYFGLVMMCGDGFTTTLPSMENPLEVSKGATVVTANTNANITADNETDPRKGFYSYTVADENTSPVMDLYLTYDNTFFNSLLGSVLFTLVEYDDNGNPTGNYTEVEAYVSTILNEFKDMDLDLVATSNEGTSNIFLKRGILPATLSTRELYIQSVKWYPTKPDSEKSQDFTNMSDLAFTLSGDRTNNPLNPGYIITDNPTANPYRFAVNIIPAENSSSGATSDIGWYTIDSPSTDVYTLVKSNPATGASVNEGTLGSLVPITGSGSNVNFTDLTGGGANRGVQLGVLDGRGLAGLNFELFYDGRFTTPYRGYYVGDIVLGMNSYIRGCDTCDDNPFNITLHIKVRPGTDTIFVGTVDNLAIGNGASYNNNHPENEEFGRRPMYWAKTLEDVQYLWKEGTVVCVVDEVIVNEDMTAGNSFFGSPNADEPMKIIRYTGHHTDKPNESGVYRGPMINVTGDGNITFRNVVFQGSATGMLDNTTATHWPSSEPNLIKGRHSVEHLKADTNVAFGPILAVTGGGHVTLGNNVVLEENWNAYTGSDAKYRGGAVSISGVGSTLQLQENVTIRRNIVPNNRATLQHSDNGAVYLDTRASLQLANSSEGSAVKIVENYLDDVVTTSAKVGTTTPSTQFWSAVMTEDPSNPLLLGWVVDSTALSSLPKANVFLVRKADAECDGTYEDYSSAVQFSTRNLPVNTKIGISRWFPGDPAEGEYPRDTIQFAFHKETGQNISAANATAQASVSNENFSSDEGYNIIYKSTLNQNIVYFYRCATFRHQDVALGEDDPLTWDGEDPGVLEGEALEFRGDPLATCPRGTDTLIYRVRNGFFPYTYRWLDNETGELLKEVRNTKISNNNVMNAYDEGNYAPFFAAVYDTLVIPYVKLPIDNTSQTVDYTVTATDDFGCVLSKRIQISMYKDRELDQVNAFEKTPVVAHWTDTNSYVYDNTVIAKGDRVFRGVRITAQAWPNRDASPIGVIDASVLYAQETVGTAPINLTATSFCEGDVINLAAESTIGSPCNDDDIGLENEFVMWDFDPYYGVNAEALQSNYVVPNQDAHVIAYYAPKTYWHEQAQYANHVYSQSYFTPAGVACDALSTYNDDLHIYNEAGLAWFMTQVNGLNNLPVRQFYFNKVYIHDKPGGYDMACYRWTPIGTSQYPFRGWVYGVGADPVSGSDSYANTTPLPAGQQVVIKNIIVDEPLMSHVGFFGHLDTARIEGIKFESAFIRGAHDAGVLAARSTHSRVTNVQVIDSAEADVTTTLIMTHNNSGGLIAYSENDSISNTNVAVKFVGDAVYSGGLYGYANGSTATNSAVYNYNRMNGVYLGGIAGYLDGQSPSNGLFRAKRAAQPSRITNNYVRLVTPGTSSRVGGIAGYAQNAVIENNYVHGQVESSFTDGGLAAQLGDNAVADHNYYAEGSAKLVVGGVMGRATMEDNTNFSGSGNAVTLGERVYGVDNLTRVLNIWVREQNAAGGNYKTWTSDLGNENFGYPLFGTPDLIPVASSTSLEGCEEVEWMGQLYRTDTVIVERIIDSTQMVDSTMSTLIRVHHASYTQYADSAYVGEEYMGHGFYMSAAETELLRRTLDSAGYATVVLSDSLQNAYGCDSIVLLTLTFSATKGITDVSTTTEVKVYPNPTTSVVNVAAEGMTHVEVYDNEGRRLQDYSAQGQPVVTLDVRHLATGIYYLRVHTPTGVTIQKVIKR